MSIREVCHPFTIMRYEALGWVRPNPKANAFFGAPIAHEITPLGQEVLG